MTEQEAEVLAARLKRIWGVETVEPRRNMAAPTVFHVALTGKMSLEYWNDGDGMVLLLMNSQRQVVIENFGDGCVVPKKSKHALLAAQWLPFFRRGCWLSGCDIEASAHEKAEWMQGFNREELEAWKLKF